MENAIVLSLRDKLHGCRGEAEVLSLAETLAGSERVPGEVIVKALQALIGESKFDAFEEMARFPDARNVMHGWIGQVIPYYFMHTAAEDHPVIRDILVRTGFPFDDLNLVSNGIFQHCLRHGFLEEMAEYIVLGTGSGACRKDATAAEFYHLWQKILEETRDFAPVARINASIRELIGVLGSSARAARLGPSVRLLSQMHFCRDAAEFATFRELLRPFRALLLESGYDSKDTMMLDLDGELFARLASRADDIAEKIGEILAPVCAEPIAVIFCSSQYIPYFEHFWERLRVYRPTLLVLSIDAAAGEYFGSRDDLLHVPLPLLSGSQDFARFFWRKRLEAMLAVIQTGRCAMLFGVDSIVFDDVVGLFNEMPYDIVAGDGPGLPLETTRRYGAAANADLLCFRSGPGPVALLSRVVEYSGLYLTDQSAVNIVAFGGSGKATVESFGKHRVTAIDAALGCRGAILRYPFMIRHLRDYRARNDNPDVSVFQPINKDEMFEL